MCELIECEYERDTQDDGEGFDLRKEELVIFWAGWLWEELV